MTASSRATAALPIIVERRVFVGLTGLSVGALANVTADDYLLLCIALRKKAVWEGQIGHAVDPRNRATWSCGKLMVRKVDGPAHRYNTLSSGLREAKEGKDD
jgi:hypothetical protein